MPPQKRTRLNFHKKTPTVKQQLCVVCYSQFYPYPITPSKWESATTKLFYSALGIPPLRLGDDDEDGEEDSVVSLPYCPQCHTKIGLMFNLRCQLEAIQHQYECIRNEIAFLVVETITQNCRNGPTDFIRQQIYEKWREYHEAEKLKEDYGENIGLDAMFVGYHSVGETDEDVNRDMSNNSDLVNLKTENNGNTINEERHEAPQPEHEEYDHVASMMELEMKDGMDYETQMQLQEQQRQQLQQEQQYRLQQQKQYSMNKNRNHISLAPNAVHTVVPVPTKTTKYSQANVTVPSSTDHHGLELNENNLESDAEAAAVAAESVKGFTRVSSMRGRGRGGKRRRISHENFESEAAALASETVKGFTRVTTIRGRGRGGRGRRGFGNMPRLAPASGQTANQTVSNSSNNLSQAPLKYLRGRGSRGGGRGIVRRNRGGSSKPLIAAPKNSASPPPSSNHHPPPPNNTSTTLQAPNRSAKGGLRCHLCKKKFPYATLLKLHLLTHTKKNPSHCDTDVEPKEPVDSTHWKTS